MTSTPMKAQTTTRRFVNRILLPPKDNNALRRLRFPLYSGINVSATNVSNEVVVVFSGDRLSIAFISPEFKESEISSRRSAILPDTPIGMSPAHVQQLHVMEIRFANGFADDRRCLVHIQVALTQELRESAFR
jgi:hypothetical protein